MLFTPKWGKVAQLPNFSQEEIKFEPMFFGASLPFAFANGGVITRTFVREIQTMYPAGRNPSEWILDSRAHMLKPGWMPCIPGWHVDDFYRPKAMNGQSDLWSKPRSHRLHILGVFGIDAFTEFLAPEKAAEFNFSKEDILPGESVHGAGNRILNDLNLPRKSATDGALTLFDTHDWHRGTVATMDSWRLFIRVSLFQEGLGHEDSRPIVNEIRKQTQVYLPAYEAGW